MRRCIRTAWLTLVLMLAMVATALANYPGTLDGGNLVLVDGGMGVGYYAEGDPMIPFAAEVAFVSAYNMRFFNDKLGSSPVLKKHQRVIDEQLYFRLGI